MKRTRKSQVKTSSLKDKSKFFLVLSEKPCKNKANTNCPHKEEKYYAKGMCYNCYHRKGRVMKATECPHSERTKYALGMCNNCYQNYRIASKKKCEI